eukprot:980010-Pelagomonas_calceolata.AAC.3
MVEGIGALRVAFSMPRIQCSRGHAHDWRNEWLQHCILLTRIAPQVFLAANQCGLGPQNAPAWELTLRYC